MCWETMRHATVRCSCAFRRWKESEQFGDTRQNSISVTNNYVFLRTILCYGTFVFCVREAARKASAVCAKQTEILVMCTQMFLVGSVGQMGGCKSYTSHREDMAANNEESYIPVVVNSNPLGSNATCHYAMLARFWDGKFNSNLLSY